MRSHILEVFDYFSTDETLLRLLYYYSNSFSDSPLDDIREDILKRDDKWDIINDRIKFTQNTDGFDESKKCRICYYSGDRSGHRSNMFSKFQDIIFDVLVHRSFQETDLRMEGILERIDEILKNNKFSSFGSVRELNGKPIGQVAEDYFGYRVIYRFGEFNDK